MTKTENVIIFVSLMVIPAVLYGFANFYHLYFPNETIKKAILVGILFASLEYVFKIPTIRYGRDSGLSNVTIQMVWIILTLIVSYLMGFYNPKTI